MELRKTSSTEHRLRLREKIAAIIGAALLFTLIILLMSRDRIDSSAGISSVAYACGTPTQTPAPKYNKTNPDAENPGPDDLMYKIHWWRGL